MAHRRFQRLPSTTALGRRVPVAVGFRPRLLGLSGLDRRDAGTGLLIPRCSAVHTFGMRFPLDLVFLDAGGRPCSIRRALPPRRFAADRRASAVLELPAVAAEGGESSLESEARILRPARAAEGGEFRRLRP